MKALERIIGIFLRVLLFAALFLLAAFITDRMNNLGADSVPRETGVPQFPEVCIYKDGMIINKLDGYRTRLDTSLDRTSVVPVDEGKNISAMIDSGYEGTVRYELRDLSGNKLIENGTMERVGTVNAEKVNGFIKVSGVNTGGASSGRGIYSIDLRMDMKKDVEYSFAVLLSVDGETVRYYTRVVVLERNFLSKFLDYAAEYNEKVFPSTSRVGGDEDIDYGDNQEGENKENSEPDTKKLWGNLNPVLVTTIIPRVKEISDTTALVELQYIVESDDTGRVIEYGIDDYLYLDYDNSTDSVSLTGSTRYTDEIFSSDNIPLGEKVEHEIKAERSTCKWSPNNEIGVFTEAGELWIYDREEGTAARLYGSGSRNRETDLSYFNPSNPRIISVDNEGLTYFAVVGRQNYGRLEGRNGIALYSYDLKKSELSTLFFIETTESFEGLRLGADRFDWFDPERKEFYTILDGSLQVYNISTGDSVKLSADMPEDMMYASEKGECVAFPDTGDQSGADEIILMNMKDMGEYHLSHSGRKLKIIGFKDDALVYGAAKPQDINTGSDGQTVFMFSEIYIVDGKGQTTREYKKDGFLISDVILTSNDLKLLRVTGGAGEYETAAEDHLIYKITQPEEDISLPGLLYRRSYLTEVLVRESATNYVTAKAEVSGRGGRFYVYRDSGLKESFASLGRAFAYIQQNGGVVVSAEGEMIYGIKESAPYLTVAGTFEYIKSNAEDSLAACAFMSMRCAGIDAGTGNTVPDSGGAEGGEDTDTSSGGQNGESGKGAGFVEIIAENTDVIEGLNISGATVDAAISFLSDGIPFTVRMPDGRYVLVISYNSTHIRYYDPVKGDEVRTTKRSFEEDVKDAGQEIYVYRFIK